MHRLVVSAAPGVHQPFPQSIRNMSDQINIPLLVTTAPGERWEDVHAGIQKRRLVLAERRASQLNGLVQQLPAQLADPKVMQRIADWLARALDVQVLVSEPERVLVASPTTAAGHLAYAIIRQSVESSIPEGSSGPHTQLISLPRPPVRRPSSPSPAGFSSTRPTSACCGTPPDSCVRHATREWHADLPAERLPRDYRTQA